MTLIVKNTFMPGFTEPTRNGDLEAHLTARKYDTGQGGAEIAYAFHQRIEFENIPLAAGATGFKNLSDNKDVRNHIVASCARHNCMSLIWWMVECESENRWSLYAGNWNEQLGFMVLVGPHYHPVPLVWLTVEPQRLRLLLKLEAV